MTLLKKTKGRQLCAGRPLKLTALAWAPELVTVLESQFPQVSSPVLLPEEELCRGPGAFP
jgi:hypothetical protein